MAFTAAAQMHAACWQRADLLTKPWLRGVGWRQGEGEAAWTGSQQWASATWLKTKQGMFAAPSQTQVMTSDAPWEAKWNGGKPGFHAQLTFSHWARSDGRSKRGRRDVGRSAGCVPGRGPGQDFVARVPRGPSVAALHAGSFVRKRC